MSKIAWIVIALLLVIAIGAGVIISQNIGEEEQAEQGLENQEEANQKVDKDKHFSVQHKDYPGKMAPKFSADDLTAAPAGDWITNGGNIYNGRYSPLDKLNKSNVKGLKAEWVTSLGSGYEFKYSGEATPIVYDGVMFTITGANDVQAIDAKTGELIWEYRPQLAANLDTVCCGWTSRGVALGDGKVFIGALDGRLIALNQKTGEFVWETKVEDPEKGYTITSAPLYYNGMLYTGIAGGEYGIRGFVAAYDAGKGEQLWKTYTIPGPDEVGHDTWPQDNDSWKKGGAPVWQTPAIDPELGLIYFSTGNTAPDLDGSNREGDNLFADSVLALDAKTGEYKWHFQEVHHDIWDYDAPNPVVLFDVEKDGKMRKGIAQAGKTGWIYILDRTNGEPLVGIEEKPVPQEPRQKTSPTQPFPVGDAFIPQTVTEEDVKRDLPEDWKGIIGNIFTPFWDEPVTVKPGPQGGANWPPSAYNPNTELFYVQANDTYFSFAHNEEDEANNFKEGEVWLGSIMQPVAYAPGLGTVTALDIKTNKIVWQKKWDQIAYSGLLTTKGDLLFAGHNDGRIIAYDATNGDELWEFTMDAGANAPPITYEIDGKQYISIFAAGNSLAGTTHGDKIYTFSLEGAYTSLEDIPEDKINKSPTANDPAATDKKQDAEEKDKSTAHEGLDVYKNNCLACHGDNGVGGHNGPKLQNNELVQDTERLIDQIKNGSAGMPPFKDTIDDNQINALVEYLQGLGK
ncbi:PQQ-dependent dehydrogenase, methanol/ethanol family [Bacillus sp. JJ1562]|uniref:PQQ-dependent dehydrogenase, methanol/ethanol family n=1 Tax=Bacillus sp. JJ1562 TaxID=3122960 RepID=UPI0030039BFB